jgi:hypothetical protein
MLSLSNNLFTFRVIQVAELGPKRGTMVKLKFRDFWDVAPCGHVEAVRRVRGAYFLHHQDPDTTLHPRRLLNFILAAVRT